MEMASASGARFRLFPSTGRATSSARSRTACVSPASTRTGFSRIVRGGDDRDARAEDPRASGIARFGIVARRRLSRTRADAASVPSFAADDPSRDTSDTSEGDDSMTAFVSDDGGASTTSPSGVAAETVPPIAAPPSSSLLRALGVTDGVLGVAQDRVEMVIKQALPVMGGMASQNVLNLADSVMVGRLGTACVASVGIASTLNFQCQAALQGISSGVQAMSARRVGEGRAEIAAVPLNAALVACACLGVPMAALAFAAAPDIVPRLTSDPAVLAAAVPYLRARLLAVPAVGVNFAFRGFWNAVQQPQIYMNTLLVMHLVNVATSLLLIFGFKGVNLAPFGLAQNAFAVPALGVVGAGVGTTISVWVGTALYLRMGFSRAKHMGFARERPGVADLKTLLGQAAPTSVTNLLFATGMTVMYWIVGRLGTAETAAVNVLINLMLTLVLPCMGMGLAAGALSGRALGRGDAEDAARWPWDVAKLTAAMMFGVGMIAVLIPETLLRCFLTNREAVAKATLPLRFTGVTVAFDALSVTMQNALLGVGDAKKVAAISIGTQWFLFLPLAYLGVTRFPGFDLNWLWGLYVAQRVGQGFLYARIWERGGWKDIKV